MIIESLGCVTPELVLFFCIKKSCQKQLSRWGKPNPSLHLSWFPICLRMGSLQHIQNFLEFPISNWVGFHLSRKNAPKQPGVFIVTYMTTHSSHKPIENRSIQGTASSLWSSWAAKTSLLPEDMCVEPKIWVKPLKSSILIGFSLINHPFWSTIIFGNTHMFDQSYRISQAIWWQSTVDGRDPARKPPGMYKTRRK